MPMTPGITINSNAGTASIGITIAFDRRIAVTSLAMIACITVHLIGPPPPARRRESVGRAARRDARLDGEVHVLERRCLGAGAVHVHASLDEQAHEVRHDLAVGHPHEGAFWGGRHHGHATTGPDGIRRRLVDGSAELELGVHPVPQARRDLLGPSERVEDATVEHRHPVRQSSSFTEEVGAQDHRAAVLGRQGADEVDHVPGRRWIESRGRLVEEQDIGIVEQGASEGQPLALPRRGPLHEQVGPIGHAEAFEQLIGADLHAAPVEAAHAAGEHQVLPRREPFVEPGVLGEDTRAAPHPVGIGGGIEAQDQGSSAIRSQDPVEQSHCRGLAGAVGPEESQHLALLDLEGEAIQRHAAAERPRQVEGLDGRRHRIAGPERRGRSVGQSRSPPCASRGREAREVNHRGAACAGLKRGEPGHDHRPPPGRGGGSAVPGQVHDLRRPAPSGGRPAGWSDVVGPRARRPRRHRGRQQLVLRRVVPRRPRRRARGRAAEPDEPAARDRGRARGHRRPRRDHRASRQGGRDLARPLQPAGPGARDRERGRRGRRGGAARRPAGCGPGAGGGARRRAISPSSSSRAAPRAHRRPPCSPMATSSPTSSSAKTTPVAGRVPTTSCSASSLCRTSSGSTSCSGSASLAGATAAAHRAVRSRPRGSSRWWITA